MDNEVIKNKIEEIDRRLKGIKHSICDLQSENAELQKSKAELLKQIKGNSVKTISIDYSSTGFQWSSKVQTLLKDTFKLREFRSLQLETINITMHQQDCILIKPTGGGKSLCYQLPSLLGGFTLVVSPLVSLMQDQIMIASRFGLRSVGLDASCPIATQNKVFKAMETDPVDAVQYQLIFVTPEKVAKSKKLLRALERAHADKRLARVVVDEVHCCSQWGHDFRPDYAGLHLFKRHFNSVPVLGLTATASERVVSDMKKLLGLEQQCLVLRDRYNRPNLHYRVQYLAGDDNGSMEVIVATVAFGMGIDKPDVRFVLHANMSKSLDGYYQESGRAGRDGKKADCVLLWRLSDFFRLGSVVFPERTGTTNLEAVCGYGLQETECRRRWLARVFEDEYRAEDCGNGMCCVCSPLQDTQLVNLNITEVYNMACDILDTVESARLATSSGNRKITGKKMVSELQNKLKIYKAGLVKQYPTIDTGIVIERAVARLILNNFLQQDFQFGRFNNFNYLSLGDNVVPKNCNITMDIRVPVL